MSILDYGVHWERHATQMHGYMGRLREELAAFREQSAGEIQAIINIGLKRRASKHGAHLIANR